MLSRGQFRPLRAGDRITIVNAPSKAHPLSRQKNCCHGLLHRVSHGPMHLLKTDRCTDRCTVIHIPVHKTPNPEFKFCIRETFRGLSASSCAGTCQKQISSSRNRQCLLSSVRACTRAHAYVCGSAHARMHKQRGGARRTRPRPASSRQRRGIHLGVCMRTFVHTHLCMPAVMCA